MPRRDPAELPPPELLAGLWASEHAGLMFLDEHGFVRHVNPPFARLCNEPSDHLLGRHIRQILGHDRPLDCLRSFQPLACSVERVGAHTVVGQCLPVRSSDGSACILFRVLFSDPAAVHTLHALLQKQGKGRSTPAEAAAPGQARYTFDAIIGRCEAMRTAKELALRAARSHANILLLGETGTGKELFAHAVHLNSPRAAGPFVRLNCAAMPSELLESELFGYEEGAFTGARRGGKPGKFEAADRGTLFLDEIGDMPLPMQAKILRVIQEREVDRIGSTRPVHVDVRVLAATHRNLEEMVRQGTFREDLYFRLNVIAIHIPPLRERTEDLPELINHCLARLTGEYGLPDRYLSGPALRAMQAYPWPGNVRELVNLLERLVSLVDGPAIDLADLPEAIRHPAGRRVATVQPLAPPPPAAAVKGPPRRGRPPQEPGEQTLESALLATERERLAQALEAAGNDRTAAARLLGIHRTTLYAKLRRHNLI